VPRVEVLLKSGPRSWLSGQTPHGNNGRAHKALLASLQNPAIAEAFRAVRTSLLLSCPNAPPRVLLVTSGIAQEGKSFSCLNLAAALACKGGKVLLVDADLRRGILSRTLGKGSGPGLSNVLSGEVGSDAACHHIDLVPGLMLMPAGDVVASRPELLESQQMAALIATWRQQFSYVVIDTPPVLPVADAVALSPKVDAVIVVVRFAATTRPEYYRYSGAYGYEQYGGGSEGQLLVSPSFQPRSKKESA
jgi:polysaccharide biosynthesis transport protein